MAADLSMRYPELMEPFKEMALLLMYPAVVDDSKTMDTVASGDSTRQRVRL